jgi:hypothetical protein
MPALLGNDHFQYVGFGERWEQLGDSLRDRGEPEWAAIAYAHADRHYCAYAEAWREHLPSSRFDDDGGAYLAPLHAKREALPKAPPAGSPLTWLHALCLEQIEAAAALFDASRGSAPTERAAHELLAALAGRQGATDLAARHRALASAAEPAR